MLSRCRSSFEGVETGTQLVLTSGGFVIDFRHAETSTGDSWRTGYHVLIPNVAGLQLFARRRTTRRSSGSGRGTRAGPTRLLAWCLCEPLGTSSWTREEGESNGDAASISRRCLWPTFGRIRLWPDSESFGLSPCQASFHTGLISSAI